MREIARTPPAESTARIAEMDVDVQVIVCGDFADAIAVGGAMNEPVSAYKRDMGVQQTIVRAVVAL